MNQQLRVNQLDVTDLERIHLIVAFVLVAEEMSFAKAAAIANVSPSTLSRKVSKLEDLLGTRLLERTTRRVVFTDLGAIYFRHCREILDRLKEADDVIESYHSEPQGLLRVSFPVAFGHLELSGIIADFIATYPKVKVEANYTDRFVDILEEGYNAVVRIGSLPDSSLVARKIGTNHKYLVASPDYLEEHGTPQSPADLARHDCLCFSRYAKAGTNWQFRRGEQIEAVHVTGDFRSDSSEAIFEAAQHGAGIAIIAKYICSDAIEQGKLVTVLPDWTVWPETNFYVCYASNKHLLPKTRALSDFLVQRLRGKLR
ncbi:LysR family transcriptional regulator [Rhodobacter sp. NTK016B]|uniref:LysR family transcriptional regulator n=1 Tax=Rhodobacter sp. NTK016B TaxID=2759676 RepID=UPI001A8D6C28|nr:LysR family transcriptional regulator [Rhodobacter sp. NTK016B]MBN8294823.1 LysR family transcriptional regulator [Rhodobacter sp. NTK016B]